MRSSTEVNGAMLRSRTMRLCDRFAQAFYVTHAEAQITSDYGFGLDIRVQFDRNPQLVPSTQPIRFRDIDRLDLQSVTLRILHQVAGL